ncbi:MAG: hypothetical protein MI741_18415 [Rhodospirillales bacterium]|nr:hypothetical protein [Rhodospirillales bacterium]
MQVDRSTNNDGIAHRSDAPVPAPRVRRPVGPDSSLPELTDAAVGGGFSIRRIIGDVDIRNMTPRQMAESSMDLYVSGVLPWEEYAMLAFQAELHPDYDRTIGALTGEAADPDRPRDYLKIWEERLDFEEKYNADKPPLIARTRRIVHVFRQIDSPTNVII